MVKKLKLILLGLTCFLAVNALAYPIPKSFPDSLIYQNKPLDPLCITEFNSTHSALNQCGSVQQGLKISGYNSNLMRKGFVGFDFQENDKYPSRGYSYYKPFGVINGAAIVYSVSSGGGSGEFTAIQLVKRTDNNIKVTVLNGGDRCNGGISDVIRDHNTLTYSVSITPFDFLILANDNPHHLKAYHDLLACAACCAGKAVFARHDDNFSKEKLLYVDFNHYALAGWSNSPSCFDSLIQNYLKQGKTRFNPQELQAFTQKFNQVCANQASTTK
jgi:hypothetical protein